MGIAVRVAALGTSPACAARTASRLLPRMFRCRTDDESLAGGSLLSVRRCHRSRHVAAGRQRARDQIPDSQLVISPSMLFAPKILAARRGKKERGAR